MTGLTAFPATAPLDDLTAALARDGACIVHDLLPLQQCRGLLDDLLPHLDGLAWGVDELGYRDDFHGQRTKRLHGLFGRSPLTAAVLTHPLLTGIARAVLVDSGCARDIRLSNAELMVLASGQVSQLLHSDAASWPRAQRREQVDGQEVLVSANLALTDFTTANGATRVVPGSHRWPPDRQPTDAEVCQAVMPAGSALLYTGNVLHGGGAKQDDGLRVGLYLGYCASWLRPIENHLVTNPLAAVQALPEDAQRLLDVVPGGFTVFA